MDSGIELDGALLPCKIFTAYVLFDFKYTKFVLRNRLDVCDGDFSPAETNASLETTASSDEAVVQRDNNRLEEAFRADGLGEFFDVGVVIADAV